MAAIILSSQARSKGCGRSPLLTGGMLSLVVLAMTSEASAQRPLRRLGERLRETVQSAQRVPLPASRAPAPTSPTAEAGSPRVPSGSLPPRPADRSLPTRSNYNSPQANLRPSVAPTPRAAVPYAGQASASQASASLPSPAAITQAGGGTRARLGITVETPPLRVTPGRAGSATPGAVIVGVQPESSAESAGLIAGDRIVAVDGRVIETVNDLASLLGSLSAGQRMDIMYVRDEVLGETTAVMPSAGRSSNRAAVTASRNALDDRDGLADSGASVLNRDDANGDELSSELPAPVAANPTASDVAADASNESGMQNLGRMLGGWIGSRSAAANTLDDGAAELPSAEMPADQLRDSEAALPAPRTAPQATPALGDELSPDSDLRVPLAAPAGGAFEADGYQPLSSQETNAPALDVSSLDSIEPTVRGVREPAEDPFAAGFTEAVPAAPAPEVQTQEPQEPLSTQRSASSEQDTVRFLLEEIEKLRLRVRQLESNRPAVAE